jgi:DNA-binding CsgD family transcriptional regulator
MVLAGEPGIGKTLLWRTCLDTAVALGTRVLQASPAAAEARLSFGALDDLLADSVDEALEALPPPQRRALEVALLLVETDSPPDERAVAVAFLNAVRTLSEHQPMLITVDDVQWLDASSARVLGYAIRRLRQEAVGALLALRSDGAATAPAPVAAVLEGDATTLRLGPLSTGALHKVVQERLGIVLARPTLRRVHETSRGNPLYAVEVARALASAPDTLVAGRPLPIPETLDDLLRKRIDALPEGTRTVLVAGAALADPRLDVISQALEIDAGDELLAAVDADVVVLLDARVGFVHPLLANAAQAASDSQLRRDVHRRLAAVVDDPEERARHMALATEGQDESVASSLEHAAESARARGATAAAAELCEQACALTPLERRADLHRRRMSTARLWFAAGDTARAHMLLQETLLEAHGVQRAEVMTALGKLAIVEGDQPGAAELLQRALAEAEDHDAIRAEASQSFATALFFMREQLETAREYEQVAVELAQRSGNMPLYLNSLATRGLIEALLGRPSAARTIAATFEVPDVFDERVIAWPAYHEAYLQLWLDEAHDSYSALERFVHVAEARGDESSLATILSSLSQAAFLLGRWDEALGFAEEAYEMALQVGQRHQQAWALSSRALVRASLGLEELARRDATEALEIAGERAMGVARIHAVWAIGLLGLSVDRPDETVRALAPVREQLIAGGVAEPGSMRFVPDEIEALVVLDRLDEAAEILDWLEQRGRALDRASALGGAARSRALLVASQGDLVTARRTLESSLAHYDRTDLPFERTRTTLALGVVQRRLKQRSAARATLEEAFASFEALGARLWAEKARIELTRIGGRAPSRGDLTPTEARVAGLVAEGRSNKEVAAALFVSVRTVEGHLGKIYAKLGVRSRAELASRFRH